MGWWRRRRTQAPSALQRDRMGDRLYAAHMCRSIRTLRHQDDPATTGEVEAAAELRKALIDVVLQRSEELLKLVAKLNKDQAVHGILVQLPLPKHIEEAAVIQAVNKHQARLRASVAMRLTVPAMILQEAFLSFLGLGVQAPRPNVLEVADQFGGITEVPDQSHQDVARRPQRDLGLPVLVGDP